MNGAREYAELFKTGEYGKLYIKSDYHARGRTFHIYVGEENKRVEVYGITGGQPGWTETYGWLHEGAWQNDFETLLQTRRLEVEVEKKKEQAQKLKDELKTAKTNKKILDLY